MPVCPTEASHIEKSPQDEIKQSNVHTDNRIWVSRGTLTERAREGKRAIDHYKNARKYGHLCRAVTCTMCGAAGP